MRGLARGETVMARSSRQSGENQNQADRSPICTPEKHKAMVRGLGLRKMNQIVERPDTPAFRGMVKKVPHLLALVD